MEAAGKRRLALSVLVASAALGCAAVPIPPPPAVAVTMVASQVAIAPADGGSNNLEPAYRIVLVVQNVSGQPFDYDRVDGAFFLPTNRRAIRPLLRTSPQSPPQGNSGAGAGTQPGVQSLAAGAVASLEFTSGDVTSNLFRDAGGQPISFGATFWLQGVPVTGLYAVQLPPINDLPLYEEGASADTTGQVLPLTRRGD